MKFKPQTADAAAICERLDKIIELLVILTTPQVVVAPSHVKVYHNGERMVYEEQKP